MRKLLITRGPQGAGKSTFLHEIGLGGHILCPDTIRRTLSGPVMSALGEITTSQENERRVWGRFRALLAERMSRGELLAVDATHRSKGDFKLYMELARRYRYQVAIVDFSTMPLELVLERNRGRADYQVVPEAAVLRTHKAAQQGQVPEEALHVRWSPDDAHRTAILAWLSEPLLDTTRYRAVCHIGDLQGCDAPLARWLEEHPFSRDVLYLFVGDICDRGLENGAVLRRVMALSRRENVRIHWGNHEDYLNDWSHGEPVDSAEFNQRTVPQLIEAGITPAEVGELCARLVDATFYTWGEQKVMVTHAGLATVPEHPERISTSQYALGTGSYNDPVGERFSQSAPAGWVQVHGHRNPRDLPIHAAPRTFNLEGGVEHGGALRILLLDDGGFTPVEISNAVFRGLGERVALDALRQEEVPRMPPWVGPDQPERPVLSPETLAALRAHTLVGEKSPESRPWISSINFTRDAFYRQEWDALNTTARGLFINNENHEIVARSYDKFFNLGERPETRPQHLKKNLRFPVTVWRKDNGYLGILGFDARADDLLFCSKSTPDSDFARWFEEIFDATVSAGSREKLRRYLRDAHASMAFEVIDPQRDPHIIAYDRPRLVLLDIIRRAEVFQAAPEKTLHAVGRWMGLEVKGKMGTFADWESLEGWLRQARAPGYRLSGEWVEGFVLEDAAGFQVKIKVDYYNHWKSMRSLKDRILATRRSGKPLGRDVSEGRVKAFHDWAVRQPGSLLEQDIITVRQAFLAGVELPPDEVAPVAGPSPEANGFRRALDNLAAAATIKQTTADGLLAAALLSEDKLAVLREHDLKVALVMAATPGEIRTAAAEAAGLDIDDPAPAE
jgi:predicted kinase